MISKHDALVLDATDEEKARYWSAVRKTKDCWYYEKGFRHPFGYGMFNLKRIRLSAHRVAKLWQTGQERKEFMACHQCTTKNCVNPAHVYWGTPKQNSHDRIRDKTNSHPEIRGDKHHLAVFNESTVREIWADLIKNQADLVSIAKKFKTTSQNIWVIKKKIAWRHLTDELARLPSTPQVSDFPLIIRKKYKKLGRDQVKIICDMLDAGISVQATAAHANSCGRTVLAVYYETYGRLPKVRGGAPRSCEQWALPPRTIERD